MDTINQPVQSKAGKLSWSNMALKRCTSTEHLLPASSAPTERLFRPSSQTSIHRALLTEKTPANFFYANLKLPRFSGPVIIFPRYLCFSNCSCFISDNWTFVVARHVFLPFVFSICDLKSFCTLQELRDLSRWQTNDKIGRFSRRN